MLLPPASASVLRGVMRLLSAPYMCSSNNTLFLAIPLQTRSFSSGGGDNKALRKKGYLDTRERSFVDLRRVLVRGGE